MKSVKKKKQTDRLDCPKCGTPMRLMSTGSLLRTFHCSECKEVRIMKREDIK